MLHYVHGHLPDQGPSLPELDRTTDKESPGALDTVTFALINVDPYIYTPGCLPPYTLSNRFSLPKMGSNQVLRTSRIIKDSKSFCLTFGNSSHFKSTTKCEGVLIISEATAIFCKGYR